MVYQVFNAPKSSKLVSINGALNHYDVIGADVYFFNNRVYICPCNYTVLEFVFYVPVSGISFVINPYLFDYLK